MRSRTSRSRAVSNGGLVFTTTIGTPLDAQNIVNRHFKPLLDRADLPPIRWHDLTADFSVIDPYGMRCVQTVPPKRRIDRLGMHGLCAGQHHRNPLLERSQPIY